VVWLNIPYWGHAMLVNTKIPTVTLIFLKFGLEVLQQTALNAYQSSLSL
jgi:hypothetical protein